MGQSQGASARCSILRPALHDVRIRRMRWSILTWHFEIVVPDPCHWADCALDLLPRSPSRTASSPLFPLCCRCMDHRTPQLQIASSIKDDHFHTYLTNYSIKMPGKRHSRPEKCGTDGSLLLAMKVPCVSSRYPGFFVRGQSK